MLRVSLGSSLGEPWRFHFVTSKDEPVRFSKESSDTVSLLIGDEKRMSIREEKIRRKRFGKESDDTTGTIMVWGNP